MPQSNPDTGIGRITFDPQIVEALTAQGMTQTAISKLVGVCQPAISRFLAKIVINQQLINDFDKYDAGMIKLSLARNEAYIDRVVEDADVRFDSITDNHKSNVMGRAIYQNKDLRTQLRLVEGKSTVNIGLHTTLVLAAEAEDKPSDTPISSDKSD